MQLKVKTYDLWASIYLLIIVILSALRLEYSIKEFILLFVLAIPLIKSPEHLLGISILIETISYYFIGADGTIFGINTILILTYIINLYLYRKNRGISFKCLLSQFLLIIIAIISYKGSPFFYMNGLLKFIYLLVISIFIGNLIRIDYKKLGRVLPRLAIILILGYIITLFYSRAIIDGRLTINSVVNTNTFGMSCAQLATIFFITYYIINREKKYLLMSGIAGLLGLLSGSRGAILAGIISCGIVILLYEKRRNKVKSFIAKGTIVMIILIIIIIILAPIFEIDLTRFNIDDLFSKTGSGSTRLLILKNVIPFVIENNYYLWGYGPGHECSRIVIKSLIIWNFAHTHNTVIESFVELGLMGLGFTVFCIIFSLKNSYRSSKRIKEFYVFLGMLICLLINGVAESYFCDLIFWILLAITRNINIKVNKEKK